MKFLDKICAKPTIDYKFIKGYPAIPYVKNADTWYNKLFRSEQIKLMNLKCQKGEISFFESKIFEEIRNQLKKDMQ